MHASRTTASGRFLSWLAILFVTAFSLAILSTPGAAHVAGASARAPDSSDTDSIRTHAAHEVEPAAHREAGHAAGEHGRHIGEVLPLWTIVPFIGTLLSIAMFPLFAPRWWHHHFPKVSAFWAIIFAAPFLLVFRGEAAHHILHTYFIDYFPFIILLWSLFTVSGGLYVKGTLQGSPKLNIIFLLIGTALASWMGTTGASMLLIRPVLRANAWRKAKVHIVVFFIFLVSNIGGSLTPLGDPPLFLGFLHGVPFFWTFNIFPHMGFVAVALFVLFYILDSYYYRKEEKPETLEKRPIRLEGTHNIVFLLGIIGSVLMSGFWRAGYVTVLGIEMKIQFLVRDGIMLLMGLLSIRTTNPQIHKENEFTWFPIKEVAYLFAGIFMTIIPAIQILKAGESGQLRFIMETLKSPTHYFWITGSLSSFLDNAPTYLTFFNSVLGKFFAGIGEHEAVDMLIAQRETFLKAISAGAVFMGANTYIGNAPNFMVRSIAEEAGIKMPSFFGFMIKYSIPILVPLFFLVTLIFFG